MSVLDLARPEIRALQPYSSARTEASGGSILLNANESPWSAEQAAARGFNRYPDPQPPELIARLAALYEVGTDRVLVARGSDECIDLLVRAFCRAGRDAVAISSPTFGMYAVSAQVQGAAIVDVPLAPDFSYDADALVTRIDDSVKIVFVCTPNNPTGNLVPIATIEHLTRTLANRALVVVDEAYIEFADAPSAIGLLDSHDNLVVLRTLSKAHALAGARVGSLIAHRDIVALLRKILPAYPLPTSCIAAALAALSPEALATTRRRIAALVEGRDRLATILRSIPTIIDVFPSSANFVLVRCASADSLYRRLLDRGVVVRNVSRQTALSDCLRISVGTEDEIESLHAVLSAREAAA